MNFALSQEQEMLRDAARGTLGRVPTLAAARQALDEGVDALPDLWSIATQAGWPGLVIPEDQGGAGLGTFDALLVAEEIGRALGGVGLLGHHPAAALMAAGEHPDVGVVAEGSYRPVYVPTCPPTDLDPRWTVDALRGMTREPAPTAVRAGDQIQRLNGAVAWVPDAPDADAFVVVATTPEGPVAAVVPSSQASVTPALRYDMTRSLGNIVFNEAEGTVLSVDETDLARAWYFAQALLASEAIGAVQATLDMTVQYAKQRYAFGRPIGSFQAVKLEIVEMLRRLENARSLQYFAGWAGDTRPEELPVAAYAVRTTAGLALDHASGASIAVHGGIGATWEHDAPLFFRRAQLSRRLLGGGGFAAEALGGLLLARAQESMN